MTVEHDLEIGGTEWRLQAATMPNGEVRVRLLDRDGLGYIRTQASHLGGWQNSHFHMGLRETYVVQAGWVAIAQLGPDGEVCLSRLEVGDVWTAMPGCSHNVYMGPGAMTHVIKHGLSAEGDWRTNAETGRLDKLSKAISPGQLSTLG